MSGIDFLLERSVGPRDLRAALAAALGVSSGSVEVVGSIDEASGNAPVVAQLLETKGEFTLHVALYVEDAGVPLGADAVRRVARSLGTAALVPDSSPNPYSMLLVRPDGEDERVGLDAESLDAREEYRLSSRSDE